LVPDGKVLDLKVPREERASQTLQVAFVQLYPFLRLEAAGIDRVREAVRARISEDDLREKHSAAEKKFDLLRDRVSAKLAAYEAADGRKRRGTLEERQLRAQQDHMFAKQVVWPLENATIADIFATSHGNVLQMKKRFFDELEDGLVEPAATGDSAAQDTPGGPTAAQAIDRRRHLAASKRLASGAAKAKRSPSL
jgi:hypothetical protein